MTKTRRAMLAALIVAPILVTPCRPVRAQAEGDPWYEDMGGHWAYTYVRTLWDEGVTDGEVRTRRHHGHKHREAYFYPSLVSSRAQYSMMLAKAFQLQPRDLDEPAFPDVSKDYAIFGKAAFGYIQASACEGMIVGYPDGTFRPDRPITREQAFAILVRALGLQSYAENLTYDEAYSIVRRYRDRSSISSALLREIATATRLKIIEGYPDGTLKPAQQMTRAEAATVVYRSCLVRADARPPEFSPDGDGVDDMTTFHLSTLRNRNTSSWNLYVTNYYGSVFKTMNPSFLGEAPPPSVVWDGTSDEGLRLPDGLYYYRARVTDRSKQVFWSVMKPVIISSKSLRGSVTPPVVQPGDEATALAYATGDPAGVFAATPWSGYARMNGGGAAWQHVFRVPPDARDGDYEVALRATYRGTDRDVRAPFRVEQRISLDGSLAPNPCRAGQAVSIHARSSPNVVSVRAICHPLGLPGLWLDGPGAKDEWTGSFRVPADARPGRYVVTLTGSSLTKSVSVDLDLIVDENVLDTVTFTLTG